MGDLNLVEYLNDSYLVARIQNFFGVYRIQRKKNGAIQRTDYSGVRDRYKKHAGKGECMDSSEDVLDETFMMTSSFWYYLFVFSASLGNETFLTIFFPCWLWNVDSAVGRRVIFMWTLITTIGQALKDVIKWPRPFCPPCVRLEHHWQNEYGMPSTHAMVGVTVPFSFLICTYDRYEYDLWVGLLIASVWASLICVSRLYLGMHTVADVLAGIFLAIVSMALLLPVMDTIDEFLLTSQMAPLLLLFSSVALLVIHPGADYWTPTRGDTATILGLVSGAYLASWVQFEWGIIRGPPMSPPFKVMWPSREEFMLCVLRTLIGMVIILSTRIVAKRTTEPFFRSIFKVDKSTADCRVDMTSKFCTYLLVAFNIIFGAPAFFRVLGIHRPSMYTEV